MLYLGIDPGPELQAWVMLESTNGTVEHGEWEIQRMSNIILTAHRVCIEDFVTYQRTTHDSRETIKAIGAMRFMAMQLTSRPPMVIEVPRITIAAHFGCTGRGSDAALRAAITDRFGGSKAAAWGTKKNPGPLYKMSGSHKLAALAAALYYKETEDAERRETH